MNSQRTNLLLIILIATLGNFLLWLLKVSIDTWLTSTDQKSNYISFYLVPCFAAFTFGSLFSIDWLNNKYWKIGLSLLLLSNIISIAFGSLYTFDERTEEFILYFLAIQVSWLLYLSILGMYLRFFFSSSLTDKHKNRIIIIGVIWLFVVQSFRKISSQTTSIEIIHFLMVTSVTLAFILLLSFKAERPTQDA